MRSEQFIPSHNQKHFKYVQQRAIKHLLGVWLTFINNQPIINNYKWVRCYYHGMPASTVLVQRLQNYIVQVTIPDFVLYISSSFLEIYYLVAFISLSAVN